MHPLPRSTTTQADNGSQPTLVIFTLHRLRLGALDGHFDLALVGQQRPGGLVGGFLLLQLLLQHLQLVGQINLLVAHLLQGDDKPMENKFQQLKDANSKSRKPERLTIRLYLLL